MSTHAPRTQESTTTPTLISGRWQADAASAPTTGAPLTFDNRCRYQLPNGIDAANQYDGRGRARRD